MPDELDNKFYRSYIILEMSEKCFYTDFISLIENAKFSLKQPLHQISQLNAKTSLIVRCTQKCASAMSIIRNLRSNQHVSKSYVANYNYSIHLNAR